MYEIALIPLLGFVGFSHSNSSFLISINLLKKPNSQDYQAKLSNLQYQFGMSVFELRVEEGKLEARLDAKAGVLTNFEVLDILRLRGATSDPLGSLGAVTSSECKVFDYLVLSAACNQTRECISEFLKRTEKYNLTNAEKLNIINVRPTVGASIYPFIEDCETRLQNEGEDLNELEELAKLVVETLPPPPQPPGGEEQ